MSVPPPTFRQTREVPPEDPPEVSQAGPLVHGAQVYEVFFHGPSFQVIGAAKYHDGTMVCRLNPNLPPCCRRTEAVSQMAPRLIEFALQSAGLLEVATHGRMKIPHSIGSIERYLPLDVDAPATLFASASYGSSIDDAYINVDIVDPSGRVVLSVEEYRTVVLPFAVADDKVMELQAQLRGSTSIAS